jgi:hypothetical protein
MKIILNVLLFTSTGISVSAFNVGKTVKDSVPNMASIHHEHVQKSMFVSTACASDYMELWDTQELSSACVAQSAEVSLLVKGCLSGFNATATSLDCPFDSTTLNSHDSLLAACEQVGGTNLLLNYGTVCQFSTEGINFEFVLDYTNFTDCLPSSCVLDLDALKDLYDDEVNYEAQQLDEALVMKQFDNAQCSGILGCYTFLDSSGCGCNETDPGSGRSDSLAFHINKTALGAMIAVMVATFSFII